MCKSHKSPEMVRIAVGLVRTAVMRVGLSVDLQADLERLVRKVVEAFLAHLVEAMMEEAMKEEVMREEA
jgi:hypothetical protein